MKNFWKALGALALMAGSLNLAQAAQTCQRTDFFCFESGPTGNLSTPARLDSGGNLTLLGNETVTGNSTTANNTASGITVYTPQIITGISSTTTLSPTATYVQLLSTAAFVTLGGSTGNAGQAWYAPISTTSAVAGQVVIFYSTSTTSYIVFSTATTGGASNGLWAGATTRSTANPGPAWSFIFDAVDSVWREF